MAIKDDMEDVQEAVINELITENGITNTLADDQVTESKIASSAVTTTKIADGAIIPSKLSSAVSFAPAANSLSSGQLADNAVTRPKIEDSAVSTLKLDDDAVTTVKIEDGAVTTAKIDDGAVTTAKINHDAVTPAKLDRAYLETTGGVVNGSIEVDNGEGITSVGGIKYIADSDNNAPSSGAIHNFFTDNGSTSALAILKNGTVKISNSSAPSTPTNGGVLFVQSGILRFKGQNGTVTDLAQP